MTRKLESLIEYPGIENKRKGKNEVRPLTAASPYSIGQSVVGNFINI